MVAALILAVLFGLIPAFIAKQKGRNFLLWWIYGAVLSIVAVIHALCLKPRRDDGAPPAGKQGLLTRYGLKRPANLVSAAYVTDVTGSFAPLVKYIGLRIRLQYESAQGNVTTRHIIVQELQSNVTKSGEVIPAYIRAFCEERQDKRTFRLDRVIDAVDPETGEVIDDLGTYIEARASSQSKEPGTEWPEE